MHQYSILIKFINTYYQTYTYSFQVCIINLYYNQIIFYILINLNFKIKKYNNITCLYCKLIHFLLNEFYNFFLLDLILLLSKFYKV